MQDDRQESTVMPMLPGWPACGWWSRSLMEEAQRKHQAGDGHGGWEVPAGMRMLGWAEVSG